MDRLASFLKCQLGKLSAALNSHVDALCDRAIAMASRRPAHASATQRADNPPRFCGTLRHAEVPH
jgi:hypothetical protein